MDRRTWLRHAAAFVAWLAAGSETVAAQPSTTLTWWRTTRDAVERVARQPDLAPAGTASAVVVRVDARTRGQRLRGFGAALTDASALLVAALPAATRDSLWRRLFTREGEGLGLGVVRVPVGGSDFSVRHYTYADTPGDTTLKEFSLAAEPEARLPLLRAARALNPGLQVVLAPWSAPAWMKTSQALIGGTLRDDAHEVYARYLVRTVTEYRRAGVPVTALSVQNEPGMTPPDYPGMQLSAAQRAALIGRALGTQLAAAAPEVGILEWDHNWDRPDEPLAVLADAAARRHVRGVAWHCYGGDVSAQRRVSAIHPTVETWFTECSGGAWAPVYGDNLRWNVATLLVGALRNGASAVLWWNLALDPSGGPHLGGCGNCRGVVTVDTIAQVVQPNVEYDVLAHASRFMPPGSVRIGSDDRPGAIRSVAVERPDGRRVAILLNEGRRDVEVTLRDGRRQWRVPLAAGAVVTAMWDASPRA